jgi:hypothetical protein
MLKAGALYYAMVIAVLIGIITGSLVLYNYYQLQETAYYNTRKRLIDNANSGIQLLMDRNFLIKTSNEETIDLYGNAVDTVVLKKMQWGIYSVASCTSFQGKLSHTKECILGTTRFFEDNNLCLYLADLNRPLAICGRNVITGNAYIPKAGIKQTYIEGLNFTGIKPINGIQKQSVGKLPVINSEVSNRMLSLFSGLQVSDSIINFSELIPFKTNRLFQENTICIYSAEDIILTNEMLSGNIKVFSKKSITVEKNNFLSDILLVAPSIVIRKGFSGNLQLVAHDSIVIEDNVSLSYPSSLFLAQSIGNGRIYIGEDCTITGEIWLLDKSSEKRSLVTISKNTTVEGIVYGSGYIMHQGILNGSLLCNKFYLKTNAAVYENQLLNSITDVTKLNNRFLFSELSPNPGKSAIIKWLN